MRQKWIALLIVVGLAAVAYASGLHRYYGFDQLQAHRAELLAFYERQPALTIGGFMLIQIAALALCLPGAVLTLSLAAGALFGGGWGILIVLCAVTVGDSLGFLLARYLARDWAHARFAQQFEAIDRGVARDGWLYLLALRLMAVVPFFVVNVTMALTSMRLKVFAPVSFIGLLPATAIYVNAGTALAEIDSPGEIMSPRLLVTLAALGLLPLAARYAFRSRFASEA